MSYIKNYGQKFLMFKQIINKDNPVIVEVGAHYGEDTLRFLETFQNPKIYCFEPDPRNIFAFKKHVTSDKVKLYTQALSDFEGKSTFYQSFIDLENKEVPEKYDWLSSEDYFSKNLNSSGASSLKKGYDKVLSDTIEVDVTKGSTWAEENNIQEVDLLWVDVQGAEKEVVLGFEKKIDIVKFLWVEYGEIFYEGGLNRSETIELMNTLGFVCIEQVSSQGRQGDLLFENKRLLK